jgi:glycosyltransferase involved in cell wall biosynthesis
MKHPHTGLYHFCLHLGKNLLKTNTENRKFCFYTPSSALGVFGNDACYIKQHSFQKFKLPDTSKIDIWHNTYQSSMYIPKRRGLKFLFTVHDLNLLYKEHKSAYKKKKYLDAIKERIERADQVVAISHFTMNEIKQHLDIKNKPCEVIYNGCNIEEISLLKKPAIVPAAPFLFTIGTILEKKNFHVLPCLLARNDMLLVISGITQNKNYKNKIIEEARKWNVTDRLIFTGPVSENDKQWYYKNCEAFLFPSISEGFGLPVIEAMHFGKPVVLSNYTSLPEIGGSVAYYFQNFDPDHMNEVIAMTLNQHTADKSNKIKQWALQFNWETSAKQYSALYSKLLAE